MPPEFFSLPAWLIDCTLQGSIAILVVFALVPLIRRFLGAQAAYVLWAIVILRLLVPWMPASPLHWGMPSIQAEPAPNGLVVSDLTISASIRPGKGAVPTASKATGASNPSSDATPETSLLSRTISWPPAALVIWLVGLAGILGFAIFRGIRANQLVRRARDLPDDPLLDGLLDALEGSRVRIKETGELRSPALTGVLRPIILLPLDWRQRLSPPQLRCVLAHELGHFHRGDLLWRWALLIARAVHWFNPLVWLAERNARTDQEMACDEWVLRRDRTSDPRTYGEALIAAAQKLSDHRFAFPIQAGMAESRAGLKRRIQHLVGIHPHGWRAVAASLLLTAVLVVLTGPAHSEATAKNEAPSPTPHDDMQDKLDPVPAPSPRIQPGTLVMKQATQVQIQSKVVEIPAEMAAQFLGTVDSKSSGTVTNIRALYGRKRFQDLIRSLDQKKGVDLLSAPTVTTKSGNRAVINIIREFRYPRTFEQSEDGKGVVTPSTFELKNLGVTLEVTPALTPTGDIDLILAPEIVQFDGFVNFGGTRSAKQNLDGDLFDDTYVPSASGVINQPVFSTRRMRTTITLHDGETVVLGGLPSDFGTAIEAIDSNTKPTSHARRVLFIFVTVTSIDREGRPVHGAGSAAKVNPPSSVPGQPIKNGDKFYGVPVPGKPGFVTSPFAPGAGYVDLRGFPANTEVKDPYTGQIFLTPAQDGSIPPEPPPDPASPAGKALRITIPSVEFKNATISEAMRLLQRKSSELDTESAPGERGVNMVLKLVTGQDVSQRITAKLTDISLLEALRYVAATNDLVVTSDGNSLSIEPLQVGPFITRVYQVPKVYLAGLQATDSKNLKSFWKAHGLDFPAGASVGFQPPAKLTFHNTKEEQDKMVKLFSLAEIPLATPGSDPAKSQKLNENFHNSF